MIIPIVNTCVNMFFAKARFSIIKKRAPLERKVWYSPLHKYGFLDVDRVNGKLKKTEGVNFLTGTSGVILALSSHYYDSSMVLRHLLLN